MATRQDVFEALIERYGSRIADAFLEAMDELRRGVDLQRVIAAIAQRNIDAAIAAMHLDAAALAVLEDEIAQAFRDGGDATAAALPDATPDGRALVVRFNGRNIRAEAWLRDYSSTLVTNILDDQRVALRQALEDGMERGLGPRTVALDVVGRVDRNTGRRNGGILGLTAPQQTWIENARTQLESGDAGYFDRTLRDKRFDSTIRKAMEAGEPIDPDRIEAALRNYKNRMLKLRGDTIGRTEAMTALHKAQDEALRQAVDAGQIPASAIRRIWSSTGDARVRRTHMILDGKSVGLDELFISPSGAALKFPGDPQAPAAEVINCRCFLNVGVDWLASLD